MLAVLETKYLNVAKTNKIWGLALTYKSFLSSIQDHRKWFHPIWTSTGQVMILGVNNTLLWQYNYTANNLTFYSWTSALHDSQLGIQH